MISKLNYNGFNRISIIEDDLVKGVKLLSNISPRNWPEPIDKHNRGICVMHGLELMAIDYFWIRYYEL